MESSPFVKTFNCPNCAGSVNIRAIGSSINVVCSYCSSIIDTNDENYKVVDAFTNKMQRRTVIELGQRGELFGTLWETIGYMERTDQSGNYTWSEYLLFNPMKGFRWLTEYAGHWSFVITIKEFLKPRPLANPVHVPYKKNKFNLFNKGTARVSYVLGEFYWQVRIGETVDLEEYIAPPEILSLETNNEEIVWSKGTYVDAEIIREAFQINTPLNYNIISPSGSAKTANQEFKTNSTMPLQTGVAPNQPSPISQEDASNIRKYWKYLFYGIVFIQMGMCFGYSSETVYSGQIMVLSSDIEKIKVTPPFEIKDKITSLDINISSGIRNSWLEVSGALVNDDKGETVEFDQGIEYYFGGSGEDSWSEGSPSTTVTIPAVENGKYHLNIEVSGPTINKPTLGTPIEANFGEPVILNVEVKTGSTIWANFFLALFLISIYPIYVIWKRFKFESIRWSESDFSPYYSSSDDSEED